MHRGGVPAEAAEAILVRFTDAGLIDDAAFARAWVESRHHSRGLSRRSLSAELRRNGVQNEEIREAVDALDPEQEVATARRLVERKMASTRGRPPETRARQAAGMLARKGYPPGLAFRLIREAMQDEGAEAAIDLDELQRARRRRPTPGTTATAATSATPCNSRPGGGRESQPCARRPLAPPPNGPSRRAASPHLRRRHRVRLMSG